MVWLNLTIGTILVNPWNIEVFAELIYEAIQRIERGDKRNMELINYIEKNTSFEWCSKFLFQLNLAASFEDLHQVKKLPIMIRHRNQNQKLIEIEYVPRNYNFILNNIEALLEKYSQFDLKLKFRVAPDNSIIQTVNERNLNVDLIKGSRESQEKDPGYLAADLLAQYSEMYENISVENFPDAVVLDFSCKDEEFNEFQIPEISSNLVKFFSSFPVEIIKRRSYIIIKTECRNDLKNLRGEKIEFVQVDV